MWKIMKEHLKSPEGAKRKDVGGQSKFTGKKAEEPRMDSGAVQNCAEIKSRMV